MPDSGQTRAVPAFVEDWDDDANTTISTSRATASVAGRRIHYDGSDSGYSSKAATVASDPLGRKLVKELRVDTTLLERDRQPYQMSYQVKPDLQRESSHRRQGTGSEPRTVKDEPFVHERGLCTTCDTYGRHYEKGELPRSSSMAPNHTYKSSKKVSTSMPPANENQEVPRRRQSSNKPPTPLSIYPPAAVHPPYVNTAPMYGYAGTPVTPAIAYPYSPVFSSYSTSTSANPVYSDYSYSATYFDAQPTQSIRPSDPVHRSSTYGEPVVRQMSREDEYHQPHTPNTQNPAISAYRSARKTEQDRVNMPPPERPVKRMEEASQRPSVKKSATYNTAIVDHRRAPIDDLDTEDQRHRKTATHHNSQPRPPPTSYRGPTSSEQIKRPSAQRHSVSYADSKTATQVATSSAQGQPLTRRTTVPTTSQELKELEAEAYQRDRSKMTSNELTTEKLHELNAKKRGSKSETGSTYSHRSHQSSSKGSSGKAKSHTSGHRTSIVLNNGVKLDIPDELVQNGRSISISMEGHTISVNTNDRDSEKHKEQKLLERVPSMRRADSRRSVTKSSSSASQKGKDRDDQRSSTSRRPSRNEDKTSVVSGKLPSRQPSRASSKVRTSRDYDRTKHDPEYDDRNDDDRRG